MSYCADSMASMWKKDYLGVRAVTGYFLMVGAEAGFVSEHVFKFDVMCVELLNIPSWFGEGELLQ